MAFPWDSTQAWGLPRGSIRALLTFVITSSYIVMVLMGKPVPPEYENLVLGALGLYVVPRVLSEGADFLVAKKGGGGT